jgi:hypothetical protein
MIVLHSILRHCWYSCETFMEIVELWSLEILITDTDFIIPFMSTDFIIPFMSKLLTDFLLYLLPLVIIQLVPSYEVSIESCQILGGSFPEGVRSRENNFSSVDKLIFTSYSDNNCFIIPKLFKNVQNLTFFFVIDNKIISGIENAITEPNWKKPTDLQYASSCQGL